MTVAGDLVYVVHSETEIASRLSAALKEAEFTAVAMTTESEAAEALENHHFVLPDAILTPLGDLESGDSILIQLFQANPLMEQIPLVVVASSDADERRRALRMGLLSVVFPPYDAEEVALTTRLAIEKHRSEQMLFGALSQLSVPDLLQTAEVGRRTGTVALQHEGRRGMIWLRDGCLVNGRIDDGHEGLEAIYRMIHWDTGTFEAQFGSVDVEDRFRLPPSEAVLEAMRLLDEARAAGTDDVDASRTPEPGARELEVALASLNCVASYAAHHVSEEILSERLRTSRAELDASYPQLSLFTVTSPGTVTLTEVPDGEEQQVVTAAAAWIAAFVDRMDEALAWRFSRRRLAQLVAPWRGLFAERGLLRVLGIDDVEPADHEEHESRVGRAASVPYGAFVLDADGTIADCVPHRAQGGRLDPGRLVGRRIVEIVPPELAGAVRELSASEDARSRLVAVTAGHDRLRVRATSIPTPTGRRCVTLHRAWPEVLGLEPSLGRDPLRGTLADKDGARFMAVNEDFIAAFEGVFARTLENRHQDLLQRFGKQWGLRHAVRLERVVQREFRSTLREVETQMALELMSSSLGVLGLGRFEADLGHQDRGLIVIVHHDSPFPEALPTSSPPVCGLLSGFYAALLSYLAGRQLAAREVTCSARPGDPCRFVVATEERLTSLVVATPGSPDHALLTDIARGGPS
jgi:predicted hydrocarbon binding protein